MIAVSESWKKLNQEYLLPETFVEISVGIVDVGVPALLSVHGTNEAVFSNTAAIAGNVATSNTKYATLEHNLWVLDGSRNIMPDTGPYNTPGYASNDCTDVTVTLTTSEVRSVPIPGFTITWSNEYDEYATDFTIEVKNGEVSLGVVTVNGNDTNVSEVVLNVTNYDTVVLSVHGWSLPDHRVRLERVSFGHSVTFTKKDILSYEHEQTGCLNSGEIPKNSVTFALDNTDGKWNPYNPAGIGKYLMERQLVTVRYGLSINGSIEWISGGKFYLSEWKAPANGLEASFSARDAFEFLLNGDAKTPMTGTLAELVNHAVGDSLPSNVVVTVDPGLSDYTANYDGSNSRAEVVQMCANAARCVIRCDREGNINIEPFEATHTGYEISADLSYAHPEVTLSKQLKNISVAYGAETPYVLDVETSGETQTVDNPFITNADQAARVAAWARDTLRSRKAVTGDFRADPRLDVLDVVSVESKYGVISPVAITSLKYTYSGAFRATYTGKVIPVMESNVLGQFIIGESVLG